MKKEIVDDDNMGGTNHSRRDDLLNIGTEIELLNSEDRTIKIKKRTFQVKLKI